MGIPDDTPIARVRWRGHGLTAAVVAVDIEDHDRLTDRATIVLSDPDAVVASFVLPGHEIEIEMGWGAEPTMVFAGLVQASATGSDVEGRHLTTVLAQDKSSLLHLERISEDHVGSLRSIVEKIAGRHPVALGQVVPDPDPSFDDNNPLRQHARTDLEFLQELAARFGARAFVERNGGTDQFYFVSAKRLLEAEPLGRLHHGRSSSTLREFHYERSVTRVSAQLRATTYDPVTGEVKESIGDEPTKEPDLRVDPARSRSIARHSDGLENVYLTGIEEASSAMPAAPRAAPIVGAPADPTGAGFDVVPDPTMRLGLRGWGSMTGTTSLRAKSRVTIDGVAPWAEGDWYIAAVLHSFSSGGADSDSRAPVFETRFAVTR